MGGIGADYIHTTAPPNNLAFGAPLPN